MGEQTELVIDGLCKKIGFDQSGQMVFSLQTREQKELVHIYIPIGMKTLYKEGLRWCNKHFRDKDMSFWVVFSDIGEGPFDYKLIMRKFRVHRQIDPYDGLLSWFGRMNILTIEEMVIWKGQASGYNECCIKNYINLLKLGFAPAMFMSKVIGTTAKTDHVLCHMCDEKWEGERVEAEFDLGNPSTDEELNRINDLRRKLSL